MNAATLIQQHDMMTSPEKWPMRPFLPLKKLVTGKQPELGFMYFLPPEAQLRLTPTVYFGIIYRVVDGGKTVYGKGSVGIRKIAYLKYQEVMELSSRTYPTFASIVYDGWRVD